MAPGHERAINYGEHEAYDSVGIRVKQCVR